MELKGLEGSVLRRLLWEDSLSSSTGGGGEVTSEVCRAAGGTDIAGERERGGRRKKNGVLILNGQFIVYMIQ